MNLGFVAVFLAINTAENAMEDNPYKLSSGNSYSSQSTNAPLNHDLVKVSENLVSLARWQTFFGVLGALVCVLVAFTSLSQLFIGFSVVQQRDGSEGIVSLVTLTLILVIYGIPTIKLFKASQYARLCARNAEGYSKMIESQCSFWRTVGLIVCVSLALYVAILAFGLLFGLSMMM